MRVALVALGGVVDYHGGGRVFVENLYKALKARGVAASVVSSPNELPTGVDVVHFIGLNPAEIGLARRAKAAGIPVLLYPIFSESRVYHGYELLWPLMENPLVSGQRALRRLVSIICRVMGVLEVKRVKKRFVTLFYQVDQITCTSEFEAEELSRVFSVRKPTLLVHSGVWSQSASSQSTQGKEPNRVLMVGRMEPRKNQASLIRALRRSSHKLVLVGPGQDSGSLYSKLCRKLCAGYANVTLAGEVSDDRIAMLYRTAKVFALPSYAEVASLALLEAALFGCNLVTTRGHSVGEYFHGLASLCDPWDSDGLRRHVELALTQENGQALSKLVKTNYTWETVAAEAVSAYQRAMDGKRRQTSKPTGGLDLSSGTLG